MTYHIVKLTFLAALAFAESSSYSGAGGASAVSSASASSYAGSGSSSNTYGGAGGIACASIGQPGIAVNGATSGSTSYGGGTGQRPNVANANPSGLQPSQSGSYQDPSRNTIPYGGGQGGNYGGAYGGGNAGGNSGSYPGYASGYPGSYSGSGGSGSSGGSLPFNLPAGCFSGFPQYGPDPWQIHQQIMHNLQRIHEDALRFGAPSTQTGGIPANAGAFASGTIGPQGGYGQANIYPQEEGGINVRFGESTPEGGPIQSVSGNIPPPSGSTYGISTSSQSSSSNINGQVTNRKESAVTINDNGKVTTYRAKSP